MEPYPILKDNVVFMDSSFLMKVIGIIVAVIVTATVLVPICDSLAGDDGGGGSGGGGATGDLFDLQDAYGDDFPFKTYKVYGADVGGTPFSVTTSDITNMLGVLRDRNSPYFPQFGIMFADASSNLALLGNLRYNQIIEGGDEYELYISSMSDSNPGVRLIDDESPSYNADAVFNLTVSANGSYTLDMGNGQDSNVHLSGSSVTFLAWISDVADGYMPEFIGNNEGGPINGPQISAGLKVVLPTVLYNESTTTTIGPLTPTHTITAEEVTARSVTVDGTYSGSGITSYSEVIPLVEYGGVPLMNSQGGTVSVEPSSAGFEGGILLAWLTASSGGGGGSSTDLGTAGTIIKVIPIFVILAILMGSTMLFYNGFYRGEAFTKN